MRNEDDDQFMGLVGILLVFCNLFAYAFLFKSAWNWFVAEPFAVMELGLAHAVGLRVLLTKAPTRSMEGSTSDKCVLMLKGLGVCGIAYVIALVAHSAM